MNPNPHDLINLPGYGSTEKELRKAGLWNYGIEEMLRNDIQDALCAIESAHTRLMQLKDAQNEN